jgi:hypothetical protein
VAACAAVAQELSNITPDSTQIAKKSQKFVKNVKKSLITSKNVNYTSSLRFWGPVAPKVVEMHYL